jgi:LacI family transcriptional regulator
MRRIAGELGVSVMTVSKVLNNHTDISDATRDRVLAKVQELGYHRNSVARSLTLGRTHTIAIVIPDLMHSFFVEIIAGIEPIARSRGYGLFLCCSGEDSGKERAELQMLRNRQVDGIVLASAAGSANGDVLKLLLAEGTDIVMIDRDDHPKVHCHRVLTDDERVGVLATTHLIEGGRRTIAHIGGRPIAHARRRQKGWQEALEANGIDPSPAWFVPAGFMENDGYRAMKELLSAGPRVDAVFAVNDPAAIGAMKAIWEAGLHVPGDIAVVGAGDIAHGDMLKTPLTTVSWSRTDLGTSAAELLLDALDNDEDGKDAPQRVIIPPRLVVRESSVSR